MGRQARRNQKRRSGYCIAIRECAHSSGPRPARSQHSRRQLESKKGVGHDTSPKRTSATYMAGTKGDAVNPQRARHETFSVRSAKPAMFCRPTGRRAGRHRHLSGEFEGVVQRPRPPLQKQAGAIVRGSMNCSLIPRAPAGEKRKKNRKPGAVRRQ